MTANVASQLRSFRSFDVGAYGPRVDGPIGHSLMVPDRLDLLRLAVVAILSVGLSPGVADDLPCLAPRSGQTIWFHFFFNSWRS